MPVAPRTITIGRNVLYGRANPPPRPGPSSRTLWLCMTTVRDRIREALEQGPLTSLQISQDVGIHQGEVAEHLRHLARSLAHRGQALEVEPAQCLSCGFTFEERGRFRRPSRCPQCRSERLQPPRFWVRAR